jgi:CDP-diacylglycerol--glycerol-3-phosphate 3-phosphatidyltransferase
MHQIFTNHHSPGFHINPRDVTILESPSEFKSSFEAKIKTAKKRIIIASLYIGSSQLWLVNLIKDQLELEPELRVTILIDYFRGTRIDPSGDSSASLLRSLKEKFPDRVIIALFQTPCNPYLLAIAPARFNEGIGLQHIKAYIFDNDLIISGFFQF